MVRKRLIVTTLIYLKLLTVFFSSGSIADIPEAETHKLLTKLHEQFGNCIFTVNSYCITSSCEKEVKDLVCRLNVGTAFIFDGGGYLLTIKSVIDKTTKVQVVNRKGQKFKARVIGDDETGIISILEIDQPCPSVFPKISKMRSLQEGNKVLFMGIIPGMSLRAMDGVINKIHQSDGIIEVSASGTPGTSGTPVFDMYGNVIGLLAFKVDADDSLDSSSHIKGKPSNFLVLSLEVASALARSVISKHEPSSSWMGLRVFLQPDRHQGVVIKDVERNSPAELSGLQSGDVIIEFNGCTIETPACLGLALSQTESGDVVPIKFIRQGLLKTVNVTLEKYPQKR